MNPTPTPHNAQPPQETPRFKLWRHMLDEHKLTLLESELDEIIALANAVSNPTAPEGGPIPETPALDRFSEQPQLQHVVTVSSEGAGQSAPPETATPTPETDGDCVKRINEGSQAWVKADFASRLERERDQARAQLKSMTDQFLAVSGQLGEAQEFNEWCYVNTGTDNKTSLTAILLQAMEDKKELARLRADNKALRELLSRGARMVVQFGSSIEQEPQAEAFAAEVERHIPKTNEQ